MVPVAPALFSTTNDCLSCSPSLFATERATESVAPPGGNGTTIVTGLSGQAWAAPAAAIKLSPAIHLRALRFISVSVLGFIYLLTLTILLVTLTSGIG
ncbi:hypothetical protein D3C72_2030460 [compost metagenome]